MKVFDATLERIETQDPKWRSLAVQRLEQLTMPRWALGRLMDLSVDLAGMTRSLKPAVERRLMVVMAGDHGVAEQGVSQYPQEVTVQMVHNFVHQGAGINALAKVAKADVLVADLGVKGDLTEIKRSGSVLDHRIGAGTADISTGPAMTRNDAVRSLEAGIQIATERLVDFDLVGTGDMGIGNTTPSAAIAARITGSSVRDVTGKGTGIDEERHGHKVEIVERALRVNQVDPRDGIDVLAKLGGFEIGGIAGLILGASAQRKPVIVDGFISTAAALIAWTLSPTAADYIVLAHCSAERGHQAMCNFLGKQPLLDLGMRLGEGTGAALAMPLVEGAARLLAEVKTFEEAAVSQAPTDP